MRDKQVYTKAIAISETDIEYVRKLRDTRIGNKRSLAGVLAYIIQEHKKVYGEG